jgi:2-oxoglutarate dehydrogenase E1 component
VANCTNAAQYFHLLRRQAALLKVDPLPLIVLTPKSLLRHPDATSPGRQLADGVWHPVVDDAAARSAPDDVRRLVLVSGKVYVDLMATRQAQAAAGIDGRSVAVVRVEQLYPLHSEPFEAVFSGYPNLEEIVWLQEEPENMGAWRHLSVRLGEIINERWPLRYMGRPASASPAEGSASWHAINQRAIVEGAFRLENETPRKRLEPVRGT